MRNYITLCLIPFCCFFILICSNCKKNDTEPYEPDSVDQLFKTYQIKWDAIQFNADDFDRSYRIASDPFALYAAKESQADVRFAPQYCQTLVQEVKERTSESTPIKNLIQILANQHRYDSTTFSPPTIPTYTLDSDEPLYTALNALWQHKPSFGGSTKDPWDSIESQIRTECAKLPIEFRTHVARVILALIEADQIRKPAYENMPSMDRPQLLNVTDTGTDMAHSANYFSQLVYPSMSDFQIDYLYQATMVLLNEIEGLLTYLSETTITTESSLILTSCLGKIILTTGDQNNVYSDFDTYVNAVLFIDSAGDDSYQVPTGASRSLFMPASIFIDGSGNDSYNYSMYTQGYADMGIAISCDVSGADTYTADYFSQGSGSFGVGILYDKSGDDIYTGEYRCQAVSHTGIGLLYDEGGTDQYYIVSEGQGMAYIDGIALLCDQNGNDTYVAERDFTMFDGNYKAFNADCNNSFAQGVGYGRRGDLTDMGQDGYSVAGGMGMLMDFSGTDSYTCGKFGQASGYWYGFGLLYDAEGNDSYLSDYYAQAGNAHFSISVFMDQAGNDIYEAQLNMGIGAAHDLSIAWFLEFAGDDQYTAPNLSLGGGNDQSFAFFIEMMGNDTYTSDVDTITWGQASGGDTDFVREGRNDMYTLGLFLDASGQDTYNSTGTSLENYLDSEGILIGDNSTWKQASTSTIGEPWVSLDLGIGKDGEGLSVHNILE